MKIILLVILILIIALYIFCYEFFRITMDSKLSIKKGKLVPAKVWDNDWAYKTYIEKLKHEDITQKSFDGLKLTAHFYPYTAEVPQKEPTGAYKRHPALIGNDASRRLVIMCHGWRSEWWIDNTYLFHAVRAIGSDVLLIEERGTGASEGRYLTFGVNESRDILGWAALMHERFPQKPIYLFGTSLGGASVLQTISADMPDYIKGVISDSGFTSPYELFKIIANKQMHIPAFPAVNLVSWYAKILAKVELKCKPSTERIAEKLAADKATGRTFRILLIHGGNDAIVDYHMSEANYAAAKGSEYVRYLFVPEAGHCAGYNKATAEYEKLVVEMFAESDK